MIFSRCGSTLAEMVATFSGVVPPTEHFFRRRIILSLDGGDTVSVAVSVESREEAAAGLVTGRDDIKGRKFNGSVDRIPSGI